MSLHLILILTFFVLFFISLLFNPLGVLAEVDYLILFLIFVINNVIIHKICGEYSVDFRYYSEKYTNEVCGVAAALTIIFGSIFFRIKRLFYKGKDENGKKDEEQVNTQNIDPSLREEELRKWEKKILGYEEIYEIKVKDNNDVEQGGNTESVSEQILLTNSQKRNELQYNNQPELDEELEDKEIKQIGLNPIPEKRDEMEEIRDKR